MQRLLLGLCVACAALPAAAIAAPATPAPVAPPPPSGPFAYYLMQGSRIVSQAYSNAPECSQALATLKKSLPANVAPIVCAHRRP